MSEDNTIKNQSVIQIHYSNKSISDANCIVTYTSESDSSLSEVKLGSWFRQRSRLIEFYGDISNMYISQFMFSQCNALTRVNLSGTEPVDNGTFQGTLVNAITLQHTFRNITGIKKQHIKFPNLTLANSNFYNTGVEEVKSNYKNVVRMSGEYEHCSNLKTVNFEGGLNNLIYATSVFRNCYNLTSFEYDLPRLLMGVGMFEGCKLDKASVERILDSLPNINTIKKETINSDGDITKGIYVGKDEDGNDIYSPYWGKIDGVYVKHEESIVTDPSEDGKVIARIYNKKNSRYVTFWYKRVRRIHDVKNNTQMMEFYWEEVGILKDELGILDIGMGQGVKEQVTDALNRAKEKGWIINIS